MNCAYDLRRDPKPLSLSLSGAGPGAAGLGWGEYTSHLPPD